MDIGCKAGTSAQILHLRILTVAMKLMHLLQGKADPEAFKAEADRVYGK